MKEKSSLYLVFWSRLYLTFGNKCCLRWVMPPADKDLDHSCQTSEDDCLTEKI